MRDPSTDIVKSRHCHAPRERVFQAFGELHHLEAWYAPGPDWNVAVDFVDFRVGGRYRIGFGPRDESVLYTEDGLYHEIEAPWSLVWEATRSVDGHVVSTTYCRVDLREAHDGTELHLRETGCPEEWRPARSAGWDCALDRLVRHLAHVA